MDRTKQTYRYAQWYNANKCITQCLILLRHWSSIQCHHSSAVPLICTDHCAQNLIPHSTLKTTCVWNVPSRQRVPVHHCSTPHTTTQQLCVDGPLPCSGATVWVSVTVESARKICPHHRVCNFICYVSWALGQVKLGLSAGWLAPQVRVKIKAAWTLREDLPYDDTQEDENCREGNGKPPWQILRWETVSMQPHHSAV